jgi:branched-chain amino acid transport system permease protein
VFDQLVNGLTQGGVYALLALGFTMIFGTLRMVTFAHGEVYMLGAYVGFMTVKHLYPSFFLALGFAVLASAALGALVELLAFRYLRDAPHVSSLLVTIGISVCLVNLAHLVMGPETQSLPYGLLDRLVPGEFEVGGVYITFLQLAVLGVTVLLMFLLYLFIHKSRTGMVIRATAQDYEAAYAMGVNINRVFTLSFAVGSALGGVAGVLVGLYYNLFYPTMGGLYGLKAFSASVVGGLTSLPGAVVAGLVIGLVETFSVEFGAAGLRHFFSFLFMILILVFRPGGLFPGRELVHGRGD